MVRLSSTRLSATGWPIRKSASGGLEVDGEALLLGDGQHDVADRLEDVGDRERDRLEVHQAIAAARELDDVAGHGAEPEGGAVDEAELALLHRGEGAAAAALQRLGQEENRGEGRPEVVGHLDHEFEAVVTGEAIGELLGPVELEGVADALECREEPHNLLRIEGRGPALEDGGEATAKQAELRACEDAARKRGAVAGVAR